MNLPNVEFSDVTLKLACFPTFLYQRVEFVGQPTETMIHHAYMQILAKAREIKDELNSIDLGVVYKIEP